MIPAAFLLIGPIKVFPPATPSLITVSISEGSKRTSLFKEYYKTRQDIVYF